MKEAMKEEAKRALSHLICGFYESHYIQLACTLLGYRMQEVRSSIDYSHSSKQFSIAAYDLKGNLIASGTGVDIEEATQEFAENLKSMDPIKEIKKDNDEIKEISEKLNETGSMSQYYSRITDESDLPTCESITIKFIQESDGQAPPEHVSSENEIQVEIVNEAGEYYFAIKTERFAFNDAEEAGRFFQHLHDVAKQVNWNW